MIMKKTVKNMLVLIGALVFGILYAAPFNTNLLVNGDASAGLTG